MRNIVKIHPEFSEFVLKRTIPLIECEQRQSFADFVAGKTEKWNGHILGLPATVENRNGFPVFMPENFDGIARSERMIAKTPDNLCRILHVFSAMAQFVEQAPDAFNPAPQCETDDENAQKHVETILSTLDQCLLRVFYQKPNPQPDEIVAQRKENVIVVHNPYTKPLNVPINETGITVAKALTRLDTVMAAIDLRFNSLSLPVSRPVAKAEIGKMETVFAKPQYTEREYVEFIAENGMLYMRLNAHEGVLDYPIGKSFNSRFRVKTFTGNIAKYTQRFPLSHVAFDIIENKLVMYMDENGQSSPYVVGNVDEFPNNAIAAVMAPNMDDIQKKIESAVVASKIDTQHSNRGGFLVVPNWATNNLQVKAYGRSCLLFDNPQNTANYNIPAFFAWNGDIVELLTNDEKSLSKPKITRIEICNNQTAIIYTDKGKRLSIRAFKKESVPCYPNPDDFLPYIQTEGDEQPIPTARMRVTNQHDVTLIENLRLHKIQVDKIKKIASIHKTKYVFVTPCRFNHPETPNPLTAVKCRFPGIQEFSLIVTCIQD